MYFAWKKVCSVEIRELIIRTYFSDMLEVNLHFSRKRLNWNERVQLKSKLTIFYYL